MASKTDIFSDPIKTKLLITSRGRRAKHGAAAIITRVASSAEPSSATGRFQLWPLESFAAAKRRVRKANAAQLERIVRSVQRYGVAAPVLVNTGGEIINGHLVVEAARTLGLAEVPVVQVDHLSEAEVRGLRIALNRLGETGEWDLPELTAELGELKLEGFDLADTGFSLPQIDIITLGDASTTEREHADALPDPSEITVSQLGDVWQVGEHRIICGDAGKIETYQALLGDEQVQGVFSDCFYNVPIAGNVSGLGKVKHGDFVQGCGEMSEMDFSEFLRSYLDCCRQVTTPGAAIFACMDWRSVDLLTSAGKAAGLHHLNTCVWSKGSGGMGGNYRSAHEMVVLFCAADTLAINNIKLGRHGRDRCNVWNYPGANQRGSSAAKALKLHATPKPVALVEDAICDVTRVGDIVLDPFSGSGTTLVAAHTTGRVGRTIELDPRFVDVTLRRLSDFTGTEAVHAETGRSFGEMMRLRAS